MLKAYSTTIYGKTLASTCGQDDLFLVTPRGKRMLAPPTGGQYRGFAEFEKRAAMAAKEVRTWR